MKTIKLNWQLLESTIGLSDKEREAISSLIGEEKRNMDTGGTLGEREAISTYICRFEATPIESDGFSFVDLGVTGYINKIKFFLNGVEIGQTVSRHIEMGYVVENSLIKESNTLICAVISGVDTDLWIKGKGQIHYIPDSFKGFEYEMPSQITISVLKTLPSACNVTLEGNRVTIKTDGATALCDFFEGDIVRFRLCTAESHLLVNSLCLEGMEERLAPNTDISLSEEDAQIIVKSGRLEIVINKSPLNLIAYRDGKKLFEQLALPLMGDTVRGMAINLSDDEDIYGLGEGAFPTMNKRGIREDIWVRHEWITCDIPLPYYISSNGYGFYLNNSYHSFFDMGAINSDKAIIWSLGGELDYFIMLADTPKKIVADYCRITGTTKLPPLWAFGFYQSKTGLDSTQLIAEKIQKFHNANIPLDVICIDPAWERGLNDLQWNLDWFPSSEEFSKLLKDNNLHLMLWTSPFVTKPSSNYAEGDEKGMYLKDENGKTMPVWWWKDYESGIVDFTTPKAGEWWQQWLNDRMDDGAEIFKIDGGDSESVPSNAFNNDGRSAKEFHNLYPVYYAKSVYEGMQAHAPNKRVMTWERTGFVGSGRYPATWGGDQSADFEGSRVLIKGGQQAGLAGIFYWSPDVGGFGFNDKTNAEFFIRSYQWGAFCPLCRAHGNKAEPFDFGEKAQAIAGEFLRIRYRLLPYFYSMGYKAWLENLPVTRAMYLEYPDDKECRTLDYQYFVGDSIMLAPIFKEEGREDMSTEREIYFADDFIDFWTEQTYHKGEKVNFHVDIERSPVFIKRGSIIPMIDTVMNTTEYKGDSYHIHLYPSENETELTIYYDDGLTLDYQKGIYNATKLTCSLKSEGVALSITTLCDAMPINSIKFNLHIHIDGKVIDVGEIEYKNEDIDKIFAI